MVSIRRVGDMNGHELILSRGNLETQFSRFSLDTFASGVRKFSCEVLLTIPSC